jgi:molybdopterin converting factor small subunit
LAQISLLFFGAFGDAMADGPRTVDAGMPVSELAAQLAQESAAFSALYHKKGSRIAVNQSIAGADTLLHNGDVVAFLAPVSGG